MIEGLVPQICLVLSVVGLVVSAALVLTTPGWKRSPLGRVLLAYIAAPMVFWALITVGTFSPRTGVCRVPPPWLQYAEAAAFLLMPIAIWSLVAIQIRARRRIKEEQQREDLRS